MFKDSAGDTKRISAWDEILALLGGCDFSQASKTNPLEMKLAITWRKFQHELKIQLGAIKLMQSKRYFSLG